MGTHFFLLCCLWAYMQSRASSPYTPVLLLLYTGNKTICFMWWPANCCEPALSLGFSTILCSQQVCSSSRRIFSIDERAYLVKSTYYIYIPPVKYLDRNHQLVVVDGPDLTVGQEWTREKKLSK